METAQMLDGLGKSAASRREARLRRDPRAAFAASASVQDRCRW
jgi:hypothetical protein